jgi:putative FmdB family regulatory protein
VPTYDYQCRNCGAITEVIHAMQDEGPSTCDRCGGPLRRVLYPAGIIFKGSGFYSTDSRRDASKASSSATSSASGDGSGADGGAPKTGASEGSKAPASGE